MKATIFDGMKEADKRLSALAHKVKPLRTPLKLVSFVFPEDDAGLLYTELKQEASARVGVEFESRMVSMRMNLDHITGMIAGANKDAKIHGVMVQKPAKQTIIHQIGFMRQDYDVWWRTIADAIEPKKDVDCLNMINLEKVYNGTWEFLPATVKGILVTLEIAFGFKESSLSSNSKFIIKNSRLIAVVGQSEIVGKPLAAVLTQKGFEVRMLGSKSENFNEVIAQADVVVSATGVAKLITGEIVKDGVVVIDVGSPRGDVAFESIAQKASFITPVPGGVGPMTVVSLLENMLFNSKKMM